MNLPSLFLSGVAAWVLAWSAFLGLAWRNAQPQASQALTLLDDDTPARQAPER